MLPWWTQTDKGFYASPSYAKQTVAEVAERHWITHAMCASCGAGKSWGAPELLAAFPATATIGAIAERLKCSACGSDQGKVDFTQGNTPILRKPRPAS